MAAKSNNQVPADPAKSDLSPQTSEIGGMEISTTFVYYCAMTTLIGAFLAGNTLHLSLFTPQPYRLGLVAGIIGGIVGAYFNHTASFSIAAQHPQALEQQLETVLAELGYCVVDNQDIEPDTQAPTPDCLIYRRSSWHKFFSGPIIIQRQGETLTIISRAGMIRRLRAQFS